MKDKTVQLYHKAGENEHIKHMYFGPTGMESISKKIFHISRLLLDPFNAMKDYSVDGVAIVVEKRNDLDKRVINSTKLISTLNDIITTNNDSSTINISSFRHGIKPFGYYGVKDCVGIMFYGDGQCCEDKCIVCDSYISEPYFISDIDDICNDLEEYAYDWIVIRISQYEAALACDFINYCNENDDLNFTDIVSPYTPEEYVYKAIDMFLKYSVCINKDEYFKPALTCREIKELMNRSIKRYTFDTLYLNAGKLAKLITMIMNPVKDFDIIVTTANSKFDDEIMSDNSDTDVLFDNFFEDSIDVFDTNYGLEVFSNIHQINDEENIDYYNVHIKFCQLHFKRVYDIHKELAGMSNEIFILSQNQYKFLVNLLDSHSGDFEYCETAENIEYLLNTQILENIKNEKNKGEIKMQEKTIGVATRPVAPAPVTKTKTNETKVVLPEIEKVYYNKTKKTVTVFWSNGTETKAITAEGDKFSLTTGIKECFIKYACGNNFDSVQNKLQDAKKKAVLTVSKEKSKKTKVERLAAEAANLTTDEKDELVKVLTEAKNAEVKPAKKVPAKRPKRKADEIGGNN